jgi:hypothetical protein
MKVVGITSYDVVITKQHRLSKLGEGEETTMAFSRCLLAAFDDAFAELYRPLEYSLKPRFQRKGVKILESSSKEMLCIVLRVS